MSEVLMIFWAGLSGGLLHELHSSFLSESKGKPLGFETINTFNITPYLHFTFFSSSYHLFSRLAISSAFV
ncbi:unnamed protein product [Lactuca virosa]|uniref:Secreted protein n=1 Tax=Lactuca virosa TaxID=75947 RepID=A0AAU9PAS4_9ASTR|nr:unnamed protein product [Lactuca virosa]